jgi:hypothetical protein
VPVASSKGPTGMNPTGPGQRRYFRPVTLGNGGTPWSYDEFFKVSHTATVTILNAARTATLAGPLRTNSGRYAAAGDAIRA